MSKPTTDPADTRGAGCFADDDDDGERIPGSWYLVQKTFLPPNGSMSNITGSYFGYPGLVTFRVFFEFEKSGNHVNEVQKSRDVLFWDKKRPLPGMPRDSSEWVSPKSMDFQVWGRKIYPIPEMIRPKMMPWSISIHWNAPSLLFYQTNSKLKVIGRNRRRIRRTLAPPGAEVDPLMCIWIYVLSV